MKRLLVLGVFGLSSVGALAACGDDDDPAADAQDANAEFCQDLVAFGTAVKGLAGLDPTTATKDDYASAADEVTSSREDLASSGEDLKAKRWENLEAQLDTLEDQLKSAPDDVAVATILADAEAQVTKVQASVAGLNTAICTEGNSTATTG